MKKIIALVMVVFMVVLMFGCADTKIIDGKLYDTYGFLNESQKRNPDIEYELVVGNIVWSVLLVETAVAPIYFLGFSCYEPVGKAGGRETGVIN